MIIELVNRLPVDQCWNFVGEYMDTALWKDSRRTEVIVPGLNVLELESNSYFSSPSGYLIYVSDDQSLFLTIVFKSNSFLARTVSSPPDLRGIYNSSDFDKLADTAARIHRAEGCYWQINDKVSLTVFGRDMSVLSPRETEVCCEADHVPYLQDSSRVSTPMSERPSTPESESLEYVVPGSRSRRVVRITVTNLFTESFILDGDWMNSGKWRVRPFNVPAWAGQTGSQTTTFELCGEAGSITASISGCFWLISEQSKKFFVSFGFDNKPLSSSCFECWAGKPPFDLQRALGKMKSGSGSNPSVTWEVVSRPTSKKLIVNVTIGDSLLPYDASDYPPSKTSTAVATPAAEPQEVSMAIVPVPEGGVVVHPAESGETMIAEALNKSRPKNALAGLGSGLKYMSGGIVAGAAALVSAPVIGAREEGAMGLLKGVAKGVGGFVGLTVAGAAVGVTQLVRGVANTPEAISKGTRRDYKWDKDKGEWIKDVYVLRDLVDQAVQEEADSDDEERAQRGGSSGSAPTAEVKETLYYEVLGVPTNATTQDIKKAYYKKAVVVHPDKNPSPEANKEFQRLSQAYQVLSDPESRKKYDVSGAQKFEDGSHKNESLDVGIFLSGLFGSLKFEPYVGELSLSGFAKDMMKDPTMDPNDIESSMPSAASAAPLKRREKRRRIFCAKNLKDKLDKYVSERNESEFVRSAYLEAMDLVKASFGRQLLRTLAFVYLYTGEKFLAEQKGQFWTRKWASWKNTGRSYSNMANMASNMTKSFMAVNKFANQAEKRGRSENPENQGPSPEEVRAFLENTLPLLLDTAWGMVQMDVEETAKAAAKMVLKDVGVCWQLRMRRGYALRRLGRIFEEVALTYGGETEIGKMTGQDAMRQLEEAFVTTVRETDARRADSNSPSRRR